MPEDFGAAADVVLGFYPMREHRTSSKGDGRAAVRAGVPRIAQAVRPARPELEGSWRQAAESSGRRGNVTAVALDKILDEPQRRLLADERRFLADVRDLLARCDAAGEDLATLARSTEQLDELFLLVVVGEFNAGKSAFINALLGESLLEEGVTPTTTGIHLIRHGESAGRRAIDESTVEIAHPAPLLEEVTIVDTPGTNALDRRHETITSDFIPRSDLVVFVTSADRPFSESERVFLDRIRQWGKKVVVILNKVDILRKPAEVEQITAYISEHSRRLLHIEPPVFAVSARGAADAQARGDSGGLAASGLVAVEAYLHDTLDESGRVALKLANPLGVAANLLERYAVLTADQLSLLAGDLKTIDDISRQLTAYAEDIDREFGYRLADIDNLLLAMENRGAAFFDDRVRLRNLTDLIKADRLRTDFEREVVGELSEQIERRVDELIDWLVESDLNQWQSVVQHVNRRRTAHAERIVGEVGGRFEVDRSRLLETIGRAARDGVATYDRKLEAQRIAEGVQKAVAGTALVEVGAVGLGATVALLATSSAADVTGLVAAGTLAALGLFILPHRRRRAKQELADKVRQLRDRLMGRLTEQFAAEAGRSRIRIRDTVTPYERFVRAEQSLLEERRDRLNDLTDANLGLRSRVEELVDRPTM